MELVCSAQKVYKLYARPTSFPILRPNSRHIQIRDYWFLIHELPDFNHADLHIFINGCTWAFLPNRDSVVWGDHRLTERIADQKSLLPAMKISSFDPLFPKVPEGMSDSIGFVENLSDAFGSIYL